MPTFRAGSPLVVAEVGFGVAKVYVGTAYSDEQLNRSTHGETLHKLIEAVGVLEREFGICVGSGVDIADIVHRLETPSFTKENRSRGTRACTFATVLRLTWL